MSKPKVAIVRYEKPLESVRKAVDLSDGLAGLSPGSKVFIKPNVVMWSRKAPFPKWGVITTSRVVEDVVVLLKERGIDRITIGEGPVLFDPKATDTAAHAFEGLGYNVLGRRFGVTCVNVHERPFKKVDVGGGIVLKFNTDILESDFVVNIPVMKTHAQTVVSLGIKNLKGTLHINSRKKCHSADPEKDLNYMVALLPNPLPESFTLIDGIFTTERGPAFDGKIRRSNLLVASSDMLCADMAAAMLLGYEPSRVPHLVHAARNQGRSADMSEMEVVGEKIEDLAAPHQYSFAYNDTETLPVGMEKMGIKGLSYPKYDLTMCTYCSVYTGAILTSIGMAWQGKPWDDVEILTGKIMKPTPGKKTILLGKCLYQANKDHPRIKEMIAVKGCPPAPGDVVNALHQVGVEINPSILENIESAPGFFMGRYKNKPEFDESLFRIE